MGSAGGRFPWNSVARRQTLPRRSRGAQPRILARLLSGPARDSSGVPETARMIATLHDSPLYNKDLAPVPSHERTWGVYSYASLWVGMSVCIPTYMLASGLIAGGM